MVSDRQITIRPYVPCVDRQEIERWYAARESYPPPEAILPKLGCIAQNEDGVPLAAAWVYLDNSVGVCFLEWLVTAPGQTTDEAANAVWHILEFLGEDAKRMGYTIMLASASRTSLAAAAACCGFTVSGGGYHHLYKVL